jgi:DNA polymerase II
MKAFIVYPTYRIIDDKAYVYLFGRLENGESFLTINHFKPYFYVREKESEKVQKIKTEIKFNINKTKFKNFFEEPVTKITFDLPKSITILRDLLHHNDIPTYEADIRFIYRFMIDKNIKGSMDIQGDYKKGNFVNRIYEEPELTPANFTPELKVLSIDIESSMDMKTIFTISFYSKDINKVLIVSDKEFKNSESYNTEKELLIRFKELILELDPDIITGWNVIDFDLKLLKDKFRQNNIEFVFGRADWPGRVVTFESFLKDSKADIPGRMILDGIHLLKSSFISLSDYKLQTAAEEILGESKLDVFDTTNKGQEIERLYKEEPQKLIDYNLKDSELVIKILQKKGLLDLTVQRSLLTGMQLDRVRSSIASLDNLYLRETKKYGYVCNTVTFRQRTERIKGGFVKESTPGIYDYINVLDFKSLYPSIIRTFNIDPISFIPKELHDKSKNYIEAPNGARFKRDHGILPELLQTLWENRDIAKQNNDDTASFAIKITMNSFFGVLANPNCRFYSLDMANAITHWGQFIVKTTSDIVEKKGYKVIYGDTDSIFVETNLDDLKKAKDNGIMIKDFVNDYWEKFTKKIGVSNILELQYEKTYVRFLMPKIRGTEIGAKKRYAGLLIKDGKEKIDFTGLEFVRRDWTALSKKFQLTLLDKIFHKKEVVEYVKEFVNEVKQGKHDDLLIYKKSITKKLEDYTKTTPPHVKAARKLDKVTSNIIAYVITTDGPEPLQNIKHKLDYNHYIEKQIKPIADSVLVFFDKNFDDLLLNTTQTNLFSYN